jgi:hypothetical protein
MQSNANYSVGSTKCDDDEDLDWGDEDDEEDDEEDDNATCSTSNSYSSYNSTKSFYPTPVAPVTQSVNNDDEVADAYVFLSSPIAKLKNLSLDTIADNILTYEIDEIEKRFTLFAHDSALLSKVLNLFEGNEDDFTLSYDFRNYNGESVLLTEFTGLKLVSNIVRYDSMADENSSRRVVFSYSHKTPVKS